MGKIVFLALLLAAQLAANPYYENCIPCHKNLPVDLDKLFYNYLLKYSSEERVKGALRDYLQSPKESKSVMSEPFLKRFGVKAKTTLSDKELEQAIDVYWELFKVFGKLE